MPIKLSIRHPTWFKDIKLPIEKFKEFIIIY